MVMIMMMIRQNRLRDRPPLNNHASWLYVSRWFITPLDLLAITVCKVSNFFFMYNTKYMKLLYACLNIVQIYTLCEDVWDVYFVKMHGVK